MRCLLVFIFIITANLLFAQDYYSYNPISDKYYKVTLIWDNRDVTVIRSYITEYPNDTPKNLMVNLTHRNFIDGKLEILNDGKDYYLIPFVPDDDIVEISNKEPGYHCACGGVTKDEVGCILYSLDGSRVFCIEDPDNPYCENCVGFVIVRSPAGDI